MADRYDITIDKGTDWNLPMVYTEEGVIVDLTGYTASLIAEDQNGTQVLALTEASGIALGGALGTIVITRSDVETTAFAFTRANYVLTVTGAGITTRLMQGAIIIDTGGI